MSSDVTPADLLLTGGDIRTMDPEAPRASAMAVVGDSIVFVGTDEDAEKLRGPNTRHVALEGATVVPGLVDAHCHLYGLGASMEKVSLKGAPSEADAAKQVAHFASELPAGEWVTGRGWDQNLWDSKAFPTAAALDAAVGDRPAAVRRIDGHALWANSAAMRMAGIDATTKDPAGGKILRDASGAATGIFVDNAMELIEGKVPAPSQSVIERRILAASRKALSLGLSGVHEMSIGPRVVEVYRRLAKEKRLPIRVYAFHGPEGAGIELMRAERPERDAPANAMFRARGVKLFIDGALGSRGAVLLEDYSDDPGNKGLWLIEPEMVNEAAKVAVEHGWQLAIHAIGDAGNRAVLDAYEFAAQAKPDADLRFRVEHAQIVATEDLPRFESIGAIASMQPTHATSDMRWAKTRVGEGRIAGSYAIETLRRSGAHVAFGSDFPIEGVSPLLGLYAATMRQDAEGWPEGGFLPKERVSLEDAIRAFTVESAYAAFAEGELGVIRAGMVADVTVFDRRLIEGPSLLSTKVDMTLVGGAIAFEAR